MSFKDFLFGLVVGGGMILALAVFEYVTTPKKDFDFPEKKSTLESY